jgi:hypothetical protein
VEAPNSVHTIWCIPIPSNCQAPILRTAPVVGADWPGQRAAISALVPHGASPREARSVAMAAFRA